jgi:hypothetical protein
VEEIISDSEEEERYNHRQSKHHQQRRQDSPPKVRAPKCVVDFINTCQHLQEQAIPYFFEQWLALAEQKVTLVVSFDMKKLRGHQKFQESIVFIPHCYKTVWRLCVLDFRTQTKSFFFPSSTHKTPDFLNQFVMKMSVGHKMGLVN